jgi:transcription antitermination factor NusB
MINGINSREMILEILLEIEEGEHSHVAIRNALSKYQFLPKQDRAFITRVCEGTLEYRIQIDYIINSFSKVTVDKMKPAIREILRSAVYQLKYMDSVPDSAVCNEAVKLAQRKGFYNLKPFVNGVLRTIAREMDKVSFPKKEEDLLKYLSVKYSMPENLQLFLCKLIDFRNNPAGRYGYIPLADIKTAFLGKQMYKTYNVIIVIHRLAGSHHHYIGYTLAGNALDPVDLVQHLGRKQVSGPASNGRGAETASHFAAHLGGNAHRVPMFITHENALDHISIRKTEQIFPCAVNGGNLLVHHFQGRDGIFLQFFF